VDMRTPSLRREDAFPGTNALKDTPKMNASRRMRRRLSEPQVARLFDAATAVMRAGVRSKKVS